MKAQLKFKGSSLQENILENTCINTQTFLTLICSSPTFNFSITGLLLGVGVNRTKVARLY